MHVTHLHLVDYRSYAEIQIPLQPGVCVFVGSNGQGKTNLVEAVEYLATLSSHRVAADAPLAVGAAAPEPTAKDQDGKPVNFKDVYAKGTTLVYFYPKANTGGCTKQGCSLRDNWDGLTAKGIQVLGVSGVAIAPSF